MSVKRGKKTKVIIVAAVTVVILVALVSVAFYLSSAHRSIEHWTLNILPTTGPNSVTPNGTIQVPMSQTGVNVTATPHGWNGFMGWLLDGRQVGSTQGNSSESTISIPGQQDGSNHTLQAQFVMGTPPIYLIGNAQVKVKAGEYQAYNFTIPSGTGKISDIFNATGTIQVYVMNSANFTSWQKGQAASAIYSSGRVTNGYVDNVVLSSSGTYYLIYDNTNGSVAQTVDSQASYFYVPP